DDVVEFGGAIVVQGLLDRDARIVECDVEAPVILDRAIDERLHLAFVAYVGADEDGFAARFLDLVFDLLATFDIAPAERHAPALGGEDQRRSPADPGRPSGDDHDLVLETALSARLLLRQRRCLAERHAAGQTADRADDHAKGCAAYDVTPLYVRTRDAIFRHFQLPGTAERQS